MKIAQHRAKSKSHSIRRPVGALCVELKKYSPTVQNEFSNVVRSRNGFPVKSFRVLEQHPVVCLA